MKVKFLKTTAGPDGSWSAGQVADLPRAFAYALVEAGAAEQVGPDEGGGAETATAAVPETATAKPQRKARS